jgi:ketosteroid isomerase-like protein
MSRENVETVQAGFEAWNTGDMEAFRNFYAPGVTLRMPPDWPEPGPFVGRDAMMRQVEQLRSTFDTDGLELVSDFVDAGDQVVVRQRWLGAGQGPETSIESSSVFRLQDGKVVEQTLFWDHTEALEAAGARPEPEPS